MPCRVCNGELQKRNLTGLCRVCYFNERSRRVRVVRKMLGLTSNPFTRHHINDASQRLKLSVCLASAGGVPITSAYCPGCKLCFASHEKFIDVKCPRCGNLWVKKVGSASARPAD